jgi:3-oxoacyl-[acyl-carrier-protein] synthase-3
MTNRDLEKIVDTSDEWIQTRTGIRERRIAPQDEPVSTYAIEASQRAMEMAGVAAADIDLIICATVTPDMPIPATACLLQHRLGCERAAAFDIQAGCSGFIYAQSIAKQFIVSGRCRNVLVIGAELLSKFLDWTDRTTCVIFADGAGAAVMSEGSLPRGVLASAMHSDGSMSDYICMEGEARSTPRAKRPSPTRCTSSGCAATRPSRSRCGRSRTSPREVLGNAGLTPADVSVHSASGQPTDHRRGARAALDSGRALRRQHRPLRNTSRPIDSRIAPTRRPRKQVSLRRRRDPDGGFRSGPHLGGRRGALVRPFAAPVSRSRIACTPVGKTCQKSPLPRRDRARRRDSRDRPCGPFAFPVRKAELKRTEITQPSILTVAIAAFRAFAARRRRSPVAAAGHSLGEYRLTSSRERAASRTRCAAVRERGRFMQEAVPRGRGRDGRDPGS